MSGMIMKINYKICLMILLSLVTSCSSNITNINVTKENYDRVFVGMSSQEVIDIIGEADTVSKSESAGVGKMEIWHYQLGLKAISVTIINGKVFNKNWIEL